MKHLFVSLLLVVIFCKIVEPIVFAWQFAESAAKENVVVYDEQVREIKIYHPLPYHSAESQENEISKTYQENNKFYNVVEQRFAKDTFYIKIQENLSAREQFFALGNAVETMNSDANEKSEQSSSTSKITLEELSKIFPPASAPTIVAPTFCDNFDTISTPDTYLFHYLSPYLAIVTPPPTC